MAQIQQQNPIPTGQSLINPDDLQFDLNQLFATINALDATNLDRTGSEFDWLTTKLSGLIDPAGAITDSTDAQVAATKGYIKAQLFDAGGQFDPANGEWHEHANQTILDAIEVAFTTAKDNLLPTSDQKDAMDNAPTAPTAANPFVTSADIGGVAGASNNQGLFVAYVDSAVSEDVQAIPKSGLGQVRVLLDYNLYEFGVGSEQNTIEILVDVASALFTGFKYDKTAYTKTSTALYNSYDWLNQGITASPFVMASYGGLSAKQIVIYSDATNIYIGPKITSIAVDGDASCRGIWVGTDN